MAVVKINHDPRIALHHKARLSRKRRLKSLAIAWVVLIIVAFSAFCYIVRQPVLRIKRVDIVGAKALDSSVLQKAVAKNLTGSYWFIVPKNNAFFYPRKAIAADLKREFARIGEVKIKLANLNLLQVSLVERQPQASWCVSTTRGDSNRQCYLIDSGGLAFAETPVFADGVMFVINGKEQAGSSEAVLVGQTVIADNELKKILSIKETLGSALPDQDLIAVDLGLGDSYIFKVKPKNSNGSIWSLLVSNHDDPSAIAVAVKGIFTSAIFKEQVIIKKQPISYIDVRLLTKVFLKTTDPVNHATSSPAR